MLGLGLSLTQRSTFSTGGGSITLPYDPVLLMIGDSNCTGSAAAADQAAAVAAYQANPKIFALNTSTAFVQYTPGTVTGMNNWSNTPQIGLDLGFIQRFAAKYPNNNLYIIKLGRAGGFQTRGPSTGTLTGSTATNVLTKSAGADPALNELIVGDGTVPAGAIINSVKTAGTEWFMSRIQPVGGGSTAYSATVASQTLTRYLATQCFSPTEGTLWSGLAGSTTNGYRARSVNGLALLPSKKIVACVHMLGTNDKAQIAAVYNRYQQDAQDLIASMKSNWALAASVPIIMARVRNTSDVTGSNAIRAAQAAIAAADSQVQVMDMDGYSTWDGTHFPIADLTAIGSAVFDRAVF